VSRPIPSRRRPYVAIAALLIVVVAFGALLAAKLPHGPSTSNAGGIVNGKGCKHIGFLIPGGDTRWETLDHPDVNHALNKYLPGATVDTVDAQGHATTQQMQATAELAKGACILIVGAVDSLAAATIVTAAKAKNVPVIAYDRPIYSDALSYYVSYDLKSVGVAQGQYIKDHYQQYVAVNGNNNLVMIDGSQTDPGTQLFGNGAHSLLDPLISSGSLHKVYEQFTPNWDVVQAQSEMVEALAATRNQVAVAYVMNDEMANTVIAALKDVGLAGKVLVTGQDATVDGLHNILLGYQSMTVYKPISKMADSVGKLVAAISKGTNTTALASQKVKNPDGAASIPSVLSDGVEVDLGNIESTVIADGYVTPADICQGVPKGAGGVC
jgi:D-xylose transport system substrate-binding protein